MCSSWPYFQRSPAGGVLQKTAGHAEHEHILFRGAAAVYDPTGPTSLVRSIAASCPMLSISAAGTSPETGSMAFARVHHFWNALHL
jgi:hypothetical protein